MWKAAESGETSTRSLASGCLSEARTSYENPVSNEMRTLSRSYDFLCSNLCEQ